MGTSIKGFFSIWVYGLYVVCVVVFITDGKYDKRKGCTTISRVIIRKPCATKQKISTYEYFIMALIYK